MRIRLVPMDTVKFDTVTLSDVFEIDATSLRVYIGITGFPMSRR